MEHVVCDDGRRKGAEAADGEGGPVQNTVYQIPYGEFEAFVENYFPEVNEERFAKVVSKTIIDEEWLRDIVEHEKRCARESMIRRLIGCLIDDEDAPEEHSETVDGEGAVEFDVEDYLEVEEALESFSSGNVEDLVGLYKKQVNINNKRKEILEKKLRERLAYQGYWMVLRSIDSEMERLLLKKKGKKKKKDGEKEKIREILEKRSEFIELFKDVSVLEDDYRSYEDLFDPEENVDCRRHGIMPYDYFS
ncbi:hypothetical protein PFJ87_10g00960 [Encephalitozoon hellem]|uniref:Uncharacterized protein n=1 Tax=Encephalitozoon hellem TaxID=27973 RepID=A0ABY8CL51_ENCHE|nr:hypothetical protein PFJ87_10g00960 [Encephalitozoon hellem]